MKSRKIFKKITAIFAAVIMAISILPTSAFAAEVDNGGISTCATFPTGDHYVGYCTVDDTHLGGYHVFNAEWMQVKPAWKAMDSSTSEIDMYIEVRDVTSGETVFKYRFTPSEDVDGKDGSGYWYAESYWFDITPGHTYQFFYEAFTAPGYSGTGYNRVGRVELWIELGN